MLISLFRWSYETVTGSWLRSVGVRRRALLVGDPSRSQQLRDTLGSSRGGIEYDFVGDVRAGRRSSTAALARERLDELIVADSGLGEEQLLEIVDAAHRRGDRACGSRRARRTCSSSAASTCPARACRCSSCARRSSPAPTGR